MRSLWRLGCGTGIAADAFMPIGRSRDRQKAAPQSRSGFREISQPAVVRPSVKTLQSLSEARRLLPNDTENQRPNRLQIITRHWTTSFHFVENTASMGLEKRQCKRLPKIASDWRKAPSATAVRCCLPAESWMRLDGMPHARVRPSLSALRQPGAAVPGLVEHLVVGAEPEDVETVRPPGGDGRRAGEDAAERFPAGG